MANSLISQVKIGSTTYDLGHADSSSGLLAGTRLASQEEIDNFITPSKLQYGLFETTEANNIGAANNDGMLISVPWDNSAYGAQIAIDDSTDPASSIKFRSKANTWGDWKTIIHDGNYTNYSPTKTGSGASGTWNISITGNAATATTATNASKLGNVDASSYALKEDAELKWQTF